MLRFWKWSVLSCGLAAFLTLPLLAGDNDKDAKKPADKPAAKADDKKADDKPVDLDKVPDGTNAELMAYIDKVMKSQPKSPDEVPRLIKAICGAADKILDNNPTGQELEAMFTLRMRLPVSPDEMTAFGEKLAKLGAAQIKAGKAEVGREMTSLSYVVKLSVASQNPDDFKKAVEEGLKYLGEGPLQQGDLALVENMAQAVEMLEDEKFTSESLGKLAKWLKDSKLADPEVDALITRLEGTVRRLNLVGNKIELVGNLLNGQKLDLKKYEGKVFLVDFWATWCPPCVAEVPNMKKNYEAYHDKGFEIIGLSADREEEKDKLEKFVKDREIPWAIVYGDKGPSKSFEYYGIAGIPTMILVGKDGKVISTSARGEELNKLLEQQFGPPPEKADKGDKKDTKLDAVLPDLKKPAPKK